MGGAPWGGSELLWHSIALHALKQGDDVFVSVYDWCELHPMLRQLQDAGALVHTRQRFNAQAGTMEKVIRFVKNRRPSLNKDYQSIVDFRPGHVFINQGETFDLAVQHKVLYHLLRQSNIPYTLACHSHAQYSFIPPPSIFPGAVDVFKQAEQVCFVSYRQWQLTERRLVTHLNNALFTWNPLNLLLPNEPLSWPSSGTLQMALVGSLVGSKGHDTALEVLADEAWKARDWKLNVYGGGEGEEYLEALTAFYGIGDKVCFHGHVSNMKEVWQQNHLLWVPSAGEGLPISLVEAMACGRPAVVTDVGGNTQLITEASSGFIAEAPTTGSVSKALERAWKQKDDLRAMGQQAFLTIKATFDHNPHLGIYERITKVSRIAEYEQSAC